LHTTWEEQASGECSDEGMLCLLCTRAQLAGLAPLQIQSPTAVQTEPLEVARCPLPLPYFCSPAALAMVLTEPHRGLSHLRSCCLIGRGWQGWGQQPGRRAWAR
jgi:hypothetical protein